MKLTDKQQEAINTIALQTYLADIASKAKNAAIDEIAALIDKNEDAFREGLPFTFVCEDRRYRGNLVLKMTRKWAAQDLLAEAIG